MNIFQRELFYFTRIMSKRQRPASLDKQLKPQPVLKIKKQEDKQIKDKDSSPFGKLLAPKITNFSTYKSDKEVNLKRQFFRQQVVELSKALLGKVLVRKTDKGVIKAVIVETEAYKAPLDQACHAKNNNKTERTKYFWLDGGSLYIYTIYMPTNVCLNVVAGLEGEPEAVLIRAVQPIQGMELVKELRSIKSNKLEDLSNGPGKVGQALAVNKDTMNGMDLVDGQLKIVDAGLDNFNMGISRRVNIDYAGEWVDKPWRFFVQGNTYVSKVDFNAAKPKKKKA